MNFFPHTVLMIYPLIIQSTFRNPIVCLNVTDFFVNGKLTVILKMLLLF